jgi:hypothetical protein
MRSGDMPPEEAKEALQPTFQVQTRDFALEKEV